MATLAIPGRKTGRSIARSGVFRVVTTYVLPRILQWAAVIVVGVTVTFAIPRLLPTNPVDQTLAMVSARSSYSDPQAVAAFRKTLEAMYGLQGSPWDQYLRFWQNLFQGSLGPSLGAFPTPVTAIIGQALPWTIGLLGTSLVISWLLGLLLGSLSAYYPNRAWSRFLANGLVAVYPIPYYILALILLFLFAYFIPIFPLVGGAAGTQSLSPQYVVSIISHSILPAFSLVLGGTAFRFIMARALARGTMSSDYVTFAETAGLPKGKVIRQYVVRNSLLPQVTDLALSLGTLFEGAIITEVVFSYPGIGYRLYNAILQSDYNLIIGITLFSIVGVATAALLIDLVYPLVDPRVRYR